MSGTASPLSSSAASPSQQQVAVSELGGDIPALLRRWDLAYSVMSHENASTVCGVARSLDGRFIAIAPYGSDVVVLDVHNGCKVVTRVGDQWFDKMPVTVTMESLLLASALKHGDKASAGQSGESSQSSATTASSNSGNAAASASISTSSDPSKSKSTPSAAASAAMASLGSNALLASLEANLASLAKQQAHMDHSLSQLDMHLQAGLASLTADDVNLWIEDLQLLSARPAIQARRLTGEQLLRATASDLCSGPHPLSFADACELLLRCYILHHRLAPPPHMHPPPGLMSWGADVVRRWFTKSGESFAIALCAKMDALKWTGPSLCSLTVQRVVKDAEGSVDRATARVFLDTIAVLRQLEADEGIAPRWCAKWTANASITNLPAPDKDELGSGK